MVRYTRFLALLATFVAFAGADAQTPAADPSAILRELLSSDVADRIVAKIAEARARELPAAALENRALKFAARGVPAADIERSVNDHLQRLEQAKAAIQKGSGRAATSDETEAGAEVMRRGVDGAEVSDVAKNSADRRIDVPLTVIGSLMDRGLDSDEALKEVFKKLDERVSDSELLDFPNTIAASKRPAQTGTDLAATKRPAGVGARPPVGPPAGVPPNPGKTVPPVPVPPVQTPARP